MNAIGGAIMAAMSGGLLFSTEHKAVAIVCIIFSILFAVGYFDAEEEME